MESIILGRENGSDVKNPTINDEFVAKTVSTLFLKSNFAIIAVAAVTITEAKTSKFPVSPLNPFLNIKTGSIMVISVPAKAISIPKLSLLVTRSFKKNTPAIAIIIGVMAQIRLESIAVVLFVPRNRRPRATVDIRKPLRRVKSKTFGFLGIFIPLKAKIINAIIPDRKSL